MGKRTTTFNDLIRRRLREHREQRQWSQAYLAERLTGLGSRTHQTAIAKIEKGERSISLHEAVLLMAILGLAPHHLLAPDTDEVLELGPYFEVDRRAVTDWLRAQRPLHPPIIRLADSVEDLLGILRVIQGTEFIGEVDELTRKDAYQMAMDLTEQVQELIVSMAATGTHLEDSQEFNELKNTWDHLAWLRERIRRK